MGKLSNFPLAAQMNASSLPAVDEPEAEDVDAKYLDIKGKTYGKLTYKAPAPPAGSNRARMALFSCECGGEKVIAVSSVRAGMTKTCGCGQGKRIGATPTDSAPFRANKMKPVPRLPMPHQPKSEQPKPAAAETALVTIEAPAPVEVVPVQVSRDEIIQTGKDIATLIHQARKVDPEKIDALIKEILRVAESPFAVVPDGALEEALQVRMFVEALRAI
jgi:hypothetical protein